MVRAAVVNLCFSADGLSQVGNTGTGAAAASATHKSPLLGGRGNVLHGCGLGACCSFWNSCWGLCVLLLMLLMLLEAAAAVVLGRDVFKKSGVPGWRRRACRQRDGWAGRCQLHLGC